MIIYVFTALGTEFTVLMNSRILRFLVRLLYVFILKKRNILAIFCVDFVRIFKFWTVSKLWPPPSPSAHMYPLPIKKIQGNLCSYLHLHGIIPVFLLPIHSDTASIHIKMFVHIIFCSGGNCKSRKAVLLSVHDWKIQRTVSSRNWMIR